MEGFEWDIGRPKEDTIWDNDNITQLGSDFLRLVIANLQNEGATVRFDGKHQNFRPNYQIKYNNGIHQLFDGMSHEKMEPMPGFDISNFSAEFDLQEIKVAYDQLQSHIRH